MHAARNGHPSTVDVLLTYGANVQMKNGMGNYFYFKTITTLAHVICIVKFNLCSKFDTFIAYGCILATTELITSVRSHTNRQYQFM